MQRVHSGGCLVVVLAVLVAIQWRPLKAISSVRACPLDCCSQATCKRGSSRRTKCCGFPTPTKRHHWTQCAPIKQRVSRARVIVTSPDKLGRL